jgi:predicted TIM-barrel fold metal-dependent hydrolase
MNEQAPGRRGEGEGERHGRRSILKAAVAASLGGLGAAGPLGTSLPGAAQDAPFPARGGGKQRIVDVHNHPYWLGHNPRKMVENMDAHGIDQTWLLSWDAPADEISPDYFSTLNPLGAGIPFSDVVRAAEAHPDRFVPGYAIDPRHPYAREKLRSAVAIHGVRVYGELKIRVLYDDPDLISMFRLCGELGLPVVFHLDVVLPRGTPQTTRQFWYGGHIDNVERALRDCPATQFLGHAPGFWREISGDAEQEPLAYPKGRPVKAGGKILRLLDTYPNLHCDLSAGSGLTALSRDLDFTRKFLADYQDRCFFGRDDFDGKLLELLLSLALPETALQKILAGNADRLVRVA